MGAGLMFLTCEWTRALAERVMPSHTALITAIMYTLNPAGTD